MKNNSLTNEDIQVILSLIEKLYSKQDVLTRSELALLDKLEDIKEKLK